MHEAINPPTNRVHVCWCRGCKGRFTATDAEVAEWLVDSNTLQRPAPDEDEDGRNGFSIAYCDDCSPRQKAASLWLSDLITREQHEEMLADIERDEREERHREEDRENGVRDCDFFPVGTYRTRRAW